MSKTFTHLLRLANLSNWVRLLLLVVAISLSQTTPVQAQTYCTPTTDCTWGDDIDDFTFNSLSNTGTGCSNTANGYTYFPNQTTTVLLGQTYSMSMQTSGGLSQGFGVWIDWNQDGDFDDAGEFVYASPTSGTGVYNTTVTVPVTALPGNTRLRVRNEWANTLTATDDCGNWTYGETEDYTITIGGGAQVDLALNSLQNPVAACGLTSSENVEIQLMNVGSDSIPAGDTVYVSYQMDLGTVQADTLVLTSDLNSFSTLGYTFAQTVDVAGSGTYNFKAWLSYPGDSAQINDTLQVSIDNPVIDSFPYLETFDNFTANNLANWTQATYDDIDWDLNSGSTGSGNTGPAGDHTTGTGQYFYTEASGSNTNKEAILESPCISLTGKVNPAVEFWYHMYGGNMGDLYVDVFSNGVWTNELLISGEQQTSESDPWKMATINLAAYSGTIQLRFRGMTGSSFTSDMAIDDVFFFEIPPVDFDVLAVDSPLVPIVGSNTVQASFINRGGTTLSNQTVTVGYKVGAGSWVDESVTISSLAWRDTFTYQFTAPWNLAAPGTYDLCVRIDPQLTGDPDAVDSICTSRCTGMSGVYSVNPNGTGDYLTIGAAAADLRNCGVSGPVVINVDSATYNEQITLTEIPGASATNTVVIDGGDSSQTVISHDGNGTWATILLDGADWVTIRNFKIVNTASTDGWGVQLTNEANHNTVANNWIVMDPSGTNDLVGVLASGSYTSESSSGNSANYTMVANNLITGGDYGIYFRGDGTSAPIIGNSYLGNEIDNTDNHAFYNYYHDSLTVQDNYSHGMRYNYAYGFYGYYLDNVNVERNTFMGNGYGIYMGNVNENTTARPLIANNILSGNEYDGAYFYDLENGDIFNNTIVSNDDNGLSFSSSDNIDLRNNIIIYRGSSSFYEAMYVSSTSFDAIDYNIYYSTGNDLVDMGPLYADLAAWRAAEPQYNEHSEVFLPNFIGFNNFHIPAAAAFKHGADVGLVLDVDRDVRCAFAPTVGADESNFIEPIPVAAFGGPDTVWVNSPTNFYNGGDPEANAAYAWYVDGVYATDSFHLTRTFSGIGTVTVKLVAMGCSGADSMTQTFTIANPVREPLADFIADQNMVEAYDAVQFTDLSAYGPTSWEWIISPALNTSSGFPLPSVTYLNGTDQFSQNPVISFDFPGTYDVCLVATNALGSDTMCYNDYITVRATQYMCIFPNVSDQPQGMLYDSGGPLANYSNSSNCSYLIQPCASSVTLTFSQFDLENNFDYLRVYDGSDNTGTPLWNIAADPRGMTGNMLNASFRNNLVAQSGQMYIEFESDGSVTDPGFEAQWTSTPANFAAPVIDFDLPDTVCTNIPVVFENLSQGQDLSYSWDLYNDQFPDASTEDFFFTFNATGTYDLKLTGENCGGMDSVIKTVTVVNPTHAPTAGFMAMNQRPAVNEVVTLEDTSTYCADSWEWTISPNTYQFVNGTDAFSQSPQVVFTDTGYYDVTLEVANSFGQSTMTRNDYFYVIDYCYPVVGSLSGDVGISYVQLGDINQASLIGDIGYSDYSAGAAATLKRGQDYSINLQRLSMNNAMQRAVWIDFDQDGEFEAAEKVAAESPAYTQSYTATISVPRTAILGATRMRVGASSGTSNLTPCGPVRFGEYEDYRVVIVPDVTAPVITLLGNEVDTIGQCEVFADSGATALDNIDGDISALIVVTGTVDEDVAGTYMLRYNVTDTAGNPAEEVTRTVVVLPDTVAPMVMLYGNPTDTTAVGSAYLDMGSLAIDNCDDTVAVTVSGMVDTTMVGTYVLTYTAQDSEGNVATETRTVVVEDQAAPELVLSGSDTMYVAVDSAWMDPGAVPQDNYDTSLTVTTTGTVNTSVIGTYTITYCVTDAAGNGPVCEDRVVIVEDRLAPGVTMILDDTLTVEVYSLFIDPGVELEDNYYADNELVVVKGGTWPGHTNTVGEYTIEYVVSDPSGNTTTKVRVIEVVDTEAPAIWLRGEDVVSLTRWTTWTDPGVEVEDNYYPDDSVAIVVGGNIDLSGRIDSPAGQYFVTYQAIDKSGNRSNQVVRIVNVLPSGVAEAIPGAHVQVYPNPTQDRFTLKLELAEREQVRISVLNGVGQEVQVVEEATLQSAQYEVDLSGHRSGLYFVRVQTEEGVMVKKVTLQR